MHPRNRHRNGYNFDELIKTTSDLTQWIKIDRYDHKSVDFSDPQAVLALNKALLQHYYDIKNWSIPEGFLCPPIPGRAEYIHHLADLLADARDGKVPVGKNINCLDIGVGANCIYPIIGQHEYGWSFVGTDISPEAIESAKNIVQSNSNIRDHIHIRLQLNATSIFNGIILPGEYFDITLCNPPFHSSKEDAERGTLRKISNLTGKKTEQATLNFGGNPHELWCEGGEAAFVHRMISESKHFQHSCFWFTSLVSKKSNLKPIYHFLREMGALEVKTINMSIGNKESRIVAWTFLDSKKQTIWKQHRWKDFTHPLA